MATVMVACCFSELWFYLGVNEAFEAETINHEGLELMYSVPRAEGPGGDA
jgi:hypothetical protein